jgi:endothelin-converting enzyme
MNEDAIKKEGIKPLMKILHSVVAAFPLTPSSPPDEQDVAGAIDLLARLGVSALVAFGTGPDDKDPDVVVVEVASPNPIGLPAKDYYKDDNVVQSYEATLTQVLEALHPAPKGEHSNAYASWMQFDQIKKYAHEVVELEKKLAAASPDAEDRDDVNVSTLPRTDRVSMLILTSRNTTIPCPSRMPIFSPRKSIYQLQSIDSHHRMSKWID